MIVKSSNKKDIQREIEDLPESALEKLYRFIEFLKNSSGHGSHLRFSWEGGLKEFGFQYSSVALQHKASEIR